MTKKQFSLIVVALFSGAV